MNAKLGAIALTLEGLATRAGVIGMLGVMLIACALAWHFGGHEPLRARAELARAKQLELSAMLRKGDVKRLTPRSQVDAFYAKFPSVAQLPDVLLGLHQTAKQAGLSPQKASYRDQAEAATPLTRVRVEIPVKGSYPAVRAWLSRVAETWPDASVESVALRRADISQAELEVTVRFSVLMRVGK